MSKVSIKEVANNSGFELEEEQILFCIDVQNNYTDEKYDAMKAMGLNIQWNSELKYYEIVNEEENQEKYLAWKASHDAECRTFKVNNERNHDSSLMMGTKDL